MKGYWIVLGTEIIDEEAQKEYGRLWKSIAEKYQAILNPSQTPALLVEARDTKRVLIVEFPSYAQAKECYNDPAYQVAIPFALKASKRELLIIEADFN